MENQNQLGKIIHEKKIPKSQQENVIRYLAGLARLIGWYHGHWFDYRNSKLTIKRSSLFKSKRR